jgi:hypothetical protein
MADILADSGLPPHLWGDVRLNVRLTFTDRLAPGYGGTP